MKKFLIGILLGLFAFSGCSLFVNEQEVTNGLLERLSSLHSAEEHFYDEYWQLSADSEIDNFVQAYEEFMEEVEALDLYMRETRFSSRQGVFRDEYNAYFRDFLIQYVDYVGQLSESLMRDGFSDELIENYSSEINDYTIQFVTLHRQFLRTVNGESARGGEEGDE